jgi:hypothetical protein
VSDAAIRKRRDAAGTRLVSAALLTLIPFFAGQKPEGPADTADHAARMRRERLIAIYVRDAQGYSIFRDSSRSEKVALRREPVYVWTNPTRANGQDGAVFVWTCRGRAEVVGTIFSFPGKGERTIDHEFLSIATTVLEVDRTGTKMPKGVLWSPRIAGITPRAVPDAPLPASSPARRLAQMRDLARDFSGSTHDMQDRRWELRLLPRPLYRYESTDPDVLDGAVFAFVTSAGTDPEAILVLEARKAPGATAPTWHYGVGRYTDMALQMRHKDREILSVPFLSGSNHEDRYHVMEDRIIPPVEGGDMPAKP